MSRLEKFHFTSRVNSDIDVRQLPAENFSNDDKDSFNIEEDDGDNGRALCEADNEEEDEATRAALQSKYNFSKPFFDDGEDAGYYFELNSESNNEEENDDMGAMFPDDDDTG
ncbi:10224_t:CDS:2 [Acaulospora colombiana]|uniref:10224_t:CDS:1 n=1 Tax=Acaulospora colombiana TaxID=27376 RepID=A0ACA9L2I1_9GLOM|nr:10224_t:CDS:2 [Acaulospora colombiana]